MLTAVNLVANLKLAVIAVINQFDQYYCYSKTNSL